MRPVIRRIIRTLFGRVLAEPEAAVGPWILSRGKFSLGPEPSSAAVSYLVGLSKARDAVLSNPHQFQQATALVT